MKRWILHFCLILGTCDALGQATLAHQKQDDVLIKIIQLFDRQDFINAHRLLQGFVPRDEWHQLQKDYYQTLCYLYTQNAQKEGQLSFFIQRHPFHALTNQLLAKFVAYYEQENEVKQKIYYLQFLIDFSCTEDEKHEWMLCLAKALYQRQAIDEATVFFNKVLAYAPQNIEASYYLGLVYYEKTDYNNAITFFQKVFDDEHGRATYPKILFYLADSYFKTKRYNNLYALANSLSTQAKTLAYVEQIYYITAEAYLKEEKYEESLLFFNKHTSILSEQASPSVYAKIGYCYYHLKDYSKAIEYLEQVAHKNKTSDYLPLYYLGLSYLEHNQKIYALNVLEKVLLLTKNETLKTEVSWAIAKLYTELQLYAEAKPKLEAFISTNPLNENIPEARALMQKIHLSSKNYVHSIQFLETQTDKSPQIAQMHQQAQYLRAAELFNEEKYSQAIPYFQVMLRNTTDSVRKVIQTYYLAECYLHTNQSQKAIPLFQEILNVNNERSIYSIKSHYSLGYAYLHIEKYVKAMHHFQAYIEQIQIVTPTPQIEQITQDVIIRLADCNFALYWFEEAEKLYQKALAEGYLHQDYCLYYQALSLKYLGRKQEALEALQEIVKRFPYSPYYAKAQRKIQNIDNNLPEALTSAATQQDTLADTLFANALQELQNHQYVEAVRLFKLFEEQYPQHQQVGEANFYIAEAYLHLEDKHWAKQFYQKSLESPKGKHFFEANIRLADLYREEQLWQNAKRYYQMACQQNKNVAEEILAQVGLMEALFYEQKYDSTALLADNILMQQYRVNSQRKALLYKAKLCYVENKLDDTIQEYLKRISLETHTLDDISIEARYIEALIMFRKQQTKTALNKLEQLYLEANNFDYWKNTILLLLSDIYQTMGKKLHAEMSLCRIIKHTTHAQLVKEAQQKLTILD